MSSTDINVRRASIQRQIERPNQRKRDESYTMDTFREEMKRRGVYGRQTPRLMTRRERARLRTLRQARKTLPVPPMPRPTGRRETWRTFVARLVQSCRARLAELEQRSPADVIPCPWGAVFGGECLHPCRCEGKREVTVGFMVAHYRLVLAEFEGKA